MVALPDSVKEAWEDRKGPIILVTVAKDGTPNAIWAGCVKMFSDDTLVVADNFFNKTQANLQAGTKGSILLMSNEGKSIQIKGTMEYQTSGEVFDDMKQWLNPKMPGHAAAVLHVEEVYSGAEKLA